MSNRLIQAALWVGAAAALAAGQEPVGELFGVGAIAYWHLNQITAKLREQQQQLQRVDRTASTTLRIERRKLNMWDNPPPSGPQACATASGPHRKPGR